MNTYAISFTDGLPGRPDFKVHDLGERQGSSARAVLDAFVEEKGVGEHYTHGNRNSVWGLGAPTLKARKVSS